MGSFIKQSYLYLLPWRFPQIDLQTFLMQSKYERPASRSAILYLLKTSLVRRLIKLPSVGFQSQTRTYPGQPETIGKCQPNTERQNP